MEVPAPELRGLEERINELLTRVEYGAEQFQLGFLFCENKSLLTAFEAQFVTRLADEPATNTIFSRTWRAEADQPFAADALEWLRSARGRPGVYWLDLHAGSELEIRKLLGLLNERRSELIDSIGGLLLVVMRNAFGGEIRALVPDLWSVRSFSMTLHDEPAPVVAFVFPDPISVEIFGNPSISSKAPEPEVLIRRARESAGRDLDPVYAIAIAETALRNVQSLEGERFDGIISDAGMILDDLLAFHSAASAFQMLVQRAKSSGARHPVTWARKLAENMLAVGKTAEAEAALKSNGNFQDLVSPTEILLYVQTQGEVALAKKDYVSAEVIFAKVLKINNGSASSGIRALAGLAQLSMQTGDIRSALSFSQQALAQSQIRIDMYGLRPAQALRHVKLLDLQHRIARLRGDPIKNPEEIQQFLEKAIASFGPVPVIVALKAQFEQGPAPGQ